MNNQLKFKVKSEKTGEVYFPQDVEILISSSTITVHTNIGVLIEDPIFFPHTGKADSNKQDIFDQDRLTMEFEGDQGAVTEIVVVRKLRGTYYLINPARPHQTELASIPLFLVPVEVKLTLCPSKN